MLVTHCDLGVGMAKSVHYLLSRSARMCYVGCEGMARRVRDN